MRFARRGRVGDRCLRDTPTWPAPATEARRHRPRVNICGLRRAMSRAMPAAGINGAPSLFLGWEYLSRAEGVQRVRLSETPVTLMHVHLG